MQPKGDRTVDTFVVFEYEVRRRLIIHHDLLPHGDATISYGFLMFCVGRFAIRRTMQYAALDMMRVGEKTTRYGTSLRSVLLFLIIYPPFLNFLY